MRYLVASIAACLSYAGCINAADFILESGVDGFQVGQPVPAELLQKLAPRLNATGSEGLRLGPVDEYPDNASLIEDTGPVESTVWLTQSIRGREVSQGWVRISLNTRTHEVTLLGANFLPDRGLNHEPRLTAAQARRKAEVQLRNQSKAVGFDATPAQLVYEFERSGEFGGHTGRLVWVFGALSWNTRQPHKVSVSAVSGEVVRIQSWRVGCFGASWVDLSLNGPEMFFC